jgi:ectoine hydroxylase-related dioxygenase (phytanoyl-CoA dioxygenase family)
MPPNEAQSISPPGQWPLTQAQTARFHTDGFVALNQITSPAELDPLRDTLDSLFSGRTAWEKGVLYDLAGTDEQNGQSRLPQILNPSQLAPRLNDMTLRPNALAIARQLLGPAATFFYEHAILKPAGYGAPTPWHQDEAHRFDPGVDYEMISIWMALQEATVDNGCMYFIPGTHHGPVLEHRSALAVPCPVHGGGVVIHHCRTLHSAGPNLTGAPRRAYVLTFRGASTPAKHTKPFPWLAAKRTAAPNRQKKWVAAHNENGDGAMRWRQLTVTKIRRRVRKAALRVVGSSPPFRKVRLGRSA